MFKLGYWYKYNSNNSNPIIWNFELKKVLDGKWRKCTWVDKNFGEAILEDISDYFFNSEFSFFIESKINPDIKKKLRRILND